MQRNNVKTQCDSAGFVTSKFLRRKDPKGVKKGLEVPDKPSHGAQQIHHDWPHSRTKVFINIVSPVPQWFLLLFLPLQVGIFSKKTMQIRLFYSIMVVFNFLEGCIYLMQNLYCTHFSNVADFIFKFQKVNLSYCSLCQGNGKSPISITFEYIG